jgi:hypothetical protein
MIKLKELSIRSKQGKTMATNVRDVQQIQGQKLLSETGQTILHLAERHGVSYTPTARDAWAREITRLAGDDVILDDVELLLIALQRTGHLSRPEALRLQVNYLREARL